MESAIFQCGKQSVKIPVPVYIRASASVAGTKEGEGPLGSLFDVVGQDDLFGCETWEEAESTLQKEAVTLAMGKAKMSKSRSRFLSVESTVSKVKLSPLSMSLFRSSSAVIAVAEAVVTPTSAPSVL